MTKQIINTNAGEVQLLEIDKTTTRVAEEPSGDGQWETGDEVVLADREGYGWAWIPTKAIETKE